MILLKDRNSSASTGDDNLIRIGKGPDRVKLYDLHWIRCGNDTTKPLSRLLHHIVAFFSLCCSVFCGHITSQNFCWGVKCLVVRIYRYLGQNRTDGTVNSPCKKFLPDRILKIKSDVALCHCRADRHRSWSIVWMVLAEFIHSSVNHTKLWRVTVCNDNLIAVLYKIRNGFYCLADRNLLLRERRSEGSVS